MKITEELLRELILTIPEFRDQILFVHQPGYNKSQCCIGWPERRERVDRAVWAIPEGESNLRIFPAWQCEGGNFIPLYEILDEFKICRSHLELFPASVYPVEYLEDRVREENENRENETWNFITDELEQGIFRDLLTYDSEELVQCTVSDLQNIADEFQRDCY